MTETLKVRINGSLTLWQELLWAMGWHPRRSGIAILALAILGWFLLQHPSGVLFGGLGVWMQYEAIRFINRQWRDYLAQAKNILISKATQGLGLTEKDASSYVSALPFGHKSVGVETAPFITLTTVSLADTFVGIYPEGQLSLPSRTLSIPKSHEEVYYRLIAAINYNAPNVVLHFSNGQLKQFVAGGEGSDAMLGELRRRLRIMGTPGLEESSRAVAQEITPPTQRSDKSSDENLFRVAPSGGIESRCCYLRISKLQEIYQDANVLSALIEQLEVPGRPSVHRMSTKEKQELIENQIDHYRRTPSSRWFGVPKLEVLAASIWMAPECPGRKTLSYKIVDEIFCAVGREADLLRPVARWLKARGYEPYMEVPLGRRRIDVLGVKKPMLGQPELLAVELKNSDEEFSRAIDQMGTFAEYSTAVYLACTPNFAAEYLSRNADSRGLKRWEPDVLERKLRAGGHGLLLVERDAVFEVMAPRKNDPPSERIKDVVNSLTNIMRIED